MGKSSTSLWATGPSSSSFVTVAVVLNFQDQFKISLQEQLFIICLTPGSISKLPYIFPCPFFVQAFNLCVATQKKVKQSAHPQKSEIRVHGRWKNLWRKWKLRSTIPRRWKNVAWLWAGKWSWESLVGALAEWEFSPKKVHESYKSGLFDCMYRIHIYIYIE